MSWIENELKFANSLIFDHSMKCAEFIQDIYSDLDTQLSALRPGKFSLECLAEKPCNMPVAPIPKIDLGPPPAAKRPALAFAPSPTRRSPDRKKPMIHRPITAPSFRSPLRQVSDNHITSSPRKQKTDSVNSSSSMSVTTTRGSTSPRKASPTRSQTGSTRSPSKSPQKSPIRYPKVQLQDSPSKPSAALSRLMAPTLSSQQHANTQTPLAARKNNAGDQSTLQLRLNLKSQQQISGVPTISSGTPLLAASNIMRPIQSKIPVSVNTPTGGTTALPIAASSSTPFRFGLKKPLAAPIAGSPSQVTLPDISDNDSDPSLLRSWAATPEVARHLQSQLAVDPHSVFGAMGPLEIDKIFAKPQLVRSRGRTSSAAWEHDGLTLKERSDYATSMGFPDRD